MKPYASLTQNTKGVPRKSPSRPKKEARHFRVQPKDRVRYRLQDLTSRVQMEKQWVLKSTYASSL